uniref:Putative pentatricopeptide repeat protein n=1 Tax=Gossypium hirsutum TaxID=3635 RepID=Q6DXT4_GOSHI|nr:putative pentatricopeptide repeat protein [Gossypium hirsutum]
MAKAAPNLCFSPLTLNQNRKENFFSSQNGCFIHKPSLKTKIFSPIFSSCIPIRISATPTRTIDHQVTDYNAKILHFCQLGDLENAMELICMCKKSELETKTYSSVLQLCAGLKSFTDGKKVHSIIKSNSVGVDEALGLKLVSFYATCGDLKEGRRVFDTMEKKNVYLWNFMVSEYAKIGDFKESICLFKIMVEKGIEGKRPESAFELFDKLCDRDVISWNSMISGYVSNGLTERGLGIYKQMMYLGIDVDLATIISVLVGCANSGTLSLGKAVHSLAIKSSFERRINFSNTLLDMYSKCGDLDGALRVFEKMGERNVVSWTSMIAGYTRDGRSDGAIKLLQQMEKEGVKLDVVAITSILHACARSGSLDNGKDVHDYIKANNMESNLFVCNALMDMYAKCGSMEAANSVFSTMVVKDIISWNTMIGELKPDSRTMACVLPACASLSALERGKEIHGYILRNGYSSDRHVANALVDLYVKCGVLGLARLLFDMIPSKDLVSWTVMIAGYGMHGYGNEAIATFNEMRDAGIEPDEVSFISILYACSHSGLLEQGWRFFYIMKNDFNIEPKLEHYACMVDLLSRTGNLSKAYEFIETLPIAPDATIWGALLCGCRNYHDIELAEKVAERVFELEPENSGYYVLLANIYAEAEKWEEVKRLREKIGKQGLRKNPGCSWIEIKGKVNLFVSGNNSSHPHSKNIESLLKKMRRKMKEEGHFPKTKYALINADEMQKEMALCGHSEKLAMAFGLLTLPPRKTIRVTKNLRVCGDCHEMAKFMSKETRREIVLRDPNRFHHFKDGYCSCRGFW